MAQPIYVTQEDLIALLTEEQQARLTDDDLNAEERQVNVEMVNTYLRYAESTVESYVGGRYGVPLPHVDETASTPVYPDALKYAVLVIARHRLFARRGIPIEDELQAEYDGVLAWLGLVRDDLADLYFGESDEGGGVAFGLSDNVIFATEDVSPAAEPSDFRSFTDWPV